MTKKRHYAEWQTDETEIIDSRAEAIRRARQQGVTGTDDEVAAELLAHYDAAVARTGDPDRTGGLAALGSIIYWRGSGEMTLGTMVRLHGTDEIGRVTSLQSGGVVGVELLPPTAT